ncbi:MAG: TlyA family RNA methyltransferase [Coriobacteriia bacterium]|nr:TlyA family RNA methyltransferase [Coriobacteriia bacterium]MCL2871114.1 TlyA family RNA methyltransferase [Coriobacteriia bacterium]
MAKKRYTGPYVSRGGEKLRGALEDFAYCAQGKRALDVGASTGGFTDCLLQAGASHVVALDVAYGQFAWKLRQDPRVQVVERTNFKNVALTDLPELADSVFAPPYDIVVADLSFISLAKLTSQFRAAIVDQGDLLLLVKPQFEAARDEVPRGGVITDPLLHIEVLQRLEVSFLEAGLAPITWSYSPIKGPRGNIEFWLHARRNDINSKVSESEANCATIEKVVSAAHVDLS